MIICE
jgi:hypothetical protein